MKKSLAIYTLSHFAVDFACGFLMSSFAWEGKYEAGTIVSAFLLYNCLAFGLQFLFGLLFDGRNHMVCAAVGCLLVLGAYIPGDGIMVCAVLAGLGNAMFHVGGGIDSLLYSGGAMRRSGIFVSSGALGIALGMYSGAVGILGRVIPALALVFCAGCIIRWGKPQDALADRIEGAEIPRRFPVLTSALGVVSLCLLSVFIRSWVGTIAKMPWKTGFMLIFAAAFVSLLGKVLGGFAADRIGARKTGAASLLLSLPLIAFFRDSAAVGLAGLLLFNMTMPITLCIAASRLHGHEGFAFGLTTLALLTGYIVGVYFHLPDGLQSVILAVGIAISAACILLAVPDTTRDRAKRRSIR